jgi:hypothetical protein
MAKHDAKTCPDCKLLKERLGSRSMGFSEEEIDLQACRRQIIEWETRYEERREWDAYH